MHEDVFTFMTLSRIILLGMTNPSDKIRSENRNTQFMFNNSPPPPHPENRVDYDNIEKYGVARGATIRI